MKYNYWRIVSSQEYLWVLLLPLGNKYYPCLPSMKTLFCPIILFNLFSSLPHLSLSLNSSLFPCYQRLMVRSNFSSSLTYSSYTCLCGLNRIYTHAWASIKDCQDIRLRFYRWTLNTNLCHISSLYMLGVTNMKFYLEK